MLNLQLLQRQRTRLYKQNIDQSLRNDLRKQFEQKQQMRKNQSMELKSQDHQALKQKVDTAMKQIKFQKQRDFYLNNRLKQQNMMLASLKNMNRQVEETVKQQLPIKGSSLLQTLYKHQQSRGSQNKNIAKKLSQQNHQQQSFHKMTNKQIKSTEIFQDQRHLQRLKQVQALHRQQYEDIKNRHSPQPRSGQLHKRLQDMNDFAYNGRDILDVLKRDDSKQVFERNRKVQSELRNQMQEKKIKDQISKNEYVGKPDDLKKSILGSVLYKSPNYNKKEYANYLVKQINESDLKRSTQRIENKQKVQISSIFGGQGGPQRLKMIKYIDHNLGIQSDYLKNLQSGNRASSPFRIRNLHDYNGQSSPQKSSIQTQQKQIQSIQNPQKVYTQMGQSNEIKYRKPQSSTQHAIRLSSSRVGQQPAKSYLGYDLIKGSQYRYEI